MNNMASQQFIHWEDIFLNKFIPQYNEFNEFYNLNINSNLLIEKYVSLFATSILVMKIFLANNGIFIADGNRNFIREFYNMELINLGRLWMEATTLVEQAHEESIQPILLTFAKTEKCLQIYKELKDVLMELI